MQLKYVLPGIIEVVPNIPALIELSTYGLLSRVCTCNGWELVTDGHLSRVGNLNGWALVTGGHWSRSLWWWFTLLLGLCFPLLSENPIEVLWVIYNSLLVFVDRPTRKHSKLGMSKLQNSDLPTRSRSRSLSPQSAARAQVGNYFGTHFEPKTKRKMITWALCTLPSSDEAKF